MSEKNSAKKAREQRLAQLREQIPEIEPEQAARASDEGAVLLDVRDENELAQGSPHNALRIGRSFLELKIDEQVADLDTPLMVMCAGGTRSLFAAADLKALGYRNVESVAGGFNRWKDESLPFEIPQLLSSEDSSRYARHLLLKEVGEAGQQKLLNASVLIVGAGGLGSPTGMYLAAAGVGTIGLVDHDVVDRSNLQRQILHTDARVGTSKAESGASTMTALNPGIQVHTHKVRLDSSNVLDVMADYDIVIDGTDNFATRYLINDACIKLGKPNVHGAIYRFEGQVSVFWPAGPDGPGPCYRCLFPEPPPPELAPSCAEAGVIGVLPGVIGTLQATEAIKLILGIGQALTSRMLYYDALQASFNELKLRRDPACKYCGDQVTEFPGFIDYEQFCSVSA